jgi:uncharacterized SAM-binding protein YcdF (DUF218 family)
MYETPHYAAAALLLPPTGLLFIALVALIALRRRPRARITVVALSVGGVLALSLPIVALALMRTIEPPALDEAALPTAQAIVILGGGRNRYAPEWGGVTVSAFTLQRLRYGAALARKTSLPVLVSGGRPEGLGPAEGDMMQGLLRDELRVDVRWNEDLSRNTRESAAFSRRLLQPLGIRRIVLVSDGWHLARARAEFERNGFTVTAAPTGLVGSRPFTLYHLVPNAESLRYAHIVMREWVGAAWYGFAASKAGSDD